MCCCDDDEDWPPPPPEGFGHDLARDSFRQGILTAQSDLENATTGVDLLFGLSCGMSQIDILACSGYRSDCEASRRELLEQLASAHAAVRIEFPDFDRDELAHGIDAAVGLILYVFESEVRRKTTTVAELDLLRAHAKICRNALHNRSLVLGRSGHQEAYREGRYNAERFASIVRRDYARMATNEIENEDLRGKIRGRPAPQRGLRLIA